MDTVQRLPISIIKNADSIQLANLTGYERQLFDNHILLTRDIIESNQLFEAFYCNLICMRHQFVFGTDGRVERTEYCPEYESDWIAINSLIVRLISSAKTMTEFLRNSADRWLVNSNSKETKYTDSFNLFISNVFERSFSYSLLINLRNYMQHGYLPVSHQDGRYCFDVIQILTSPHFDVKGKLKNDFERFLSKCEIPGQTIACISLTYTLARFTVDAIDIYRKFLFYIKKTVSSSYKSIISSSYKSIIELINSKPSIVCNYHNKFNGYIFFKEDDIHTYHAFNSNDNPNKMMSEYQKRVADIYKNEKEAWDEISQHLKLSSKTLDRLY